MASLKIEPWKPPGKDEVELAAVVALFRQGLAAQQPPEERTAVSARALLTEWLGVPRTGVLVARSIGGKIEGLCILRNEMPAVRIVFLVAREPRKGTGSALVKALRDIAAAKGAKELRARFSIKDERARSFFAKKAGFIEMEPGGEAKPGFPLVDSALPIAVA